jgi:hypothetical protein
MHVIVCLACKNMVDMNHCLAFPDGIPEPILLGENDHTEPYPGDHGIQFDSIWPELEELDQEPEIAIQ